MRGFGSFNTIKCYAPKLHIVNTDSVAHEYKLFDGEYLPPTYIYKPFENNDNPKITIKHLGEESVNEVRDFLIKERVHEIGVYSNTHAGGEKYAPIDKIKFGGKNYGNYEWVLEQCFDPFGRANHFEASKPVNIIYGNLFPLEFTLEPGKMLQITFYVQVMKNQWAIYMHDKGSLRYFGDENFMMEAGKPIGWADNNKNIFFSVEKAEAKLQELYAEYPSSHFTILPFYTFTKTK